MSDQTPRIVTAGQRETGVLCAHCGAPIQFAQSTAVCRDCGALHHETCWQLKQRCGAYECSTTSNVADSTAAPALSISRDDLAAAVPLPSRAATTSNSNANAEEPRRRWNRTSVWAFVVSLLGIPLFGLVTGLIAIVLGCVALVVHTRNHRGFALAIAAILIGLLDSVGWVVGMAYYFDMPTNLVALDQLKIDPESLEHLPDRLARALRANVVIESATGLGRQGLGSGVILTIRDGSAYIVTNRHVVDHHYTDATSSAPEDLSSLGKIFVQTVEQSAVPGKVEWIAPHGVDLAIVSAPIFGDAVKEAHWDRKASPHIGDKVFAIGNPQGLGWTHSAGDISQVRRRTQNGYEFRVLQTTAAINPGNSGGGLYDENGGLVGINTLTADKHFAEGLSFSIALPTLFDLIPERLQIPDRNLEDASK